MAATESFLPESVRFAALGKPSQPVNPHAQRLQVAAHKKVRQLALPKGKAKAKAKSKAKAKGGPKKKAQAKGKPKSGARSKTVYGNAKDAYFNWLLVFSIQASTHMASSTIS